MKSYLFKRYSLYSNTQNAGPIVIVLLMISLICTCFFLEKFNEYQQQVVNSHNQAYLSLEKQINDKQDEVDKLNHEINELKYKQRSYDK